MMIEGRKKTTIPTRMIMVAGIIRQQPAAAASSAASEFAELSQQFFVIAAAQASPLLAHPGHGLTSANHSLHGVVEPAHGALLPTVVVLVTLYALPAAAASPLAGTGFRAPGRRRAGRIICRVLWRRLLALRACCREAA